MAKNITLFHNPKAGDEDHEKEDLLSIIKGAGYHCRYISVKEEDWDHIPTDTDWVAVAGGDGTVRKLIELMLHQPAHIRNLPIGILPLGTANNIAKTLDIKKRPEILVRSWGKKSTIFNTATVTFNTQKFPMAEGAGVGLFPYHILHMKSMKSRKETTVEKLRRDRETLVSSVETFQPFEAVIHMDGAEHSGKFLMIEVLNTSTIGPNLRLAPGADVSDGLLEVVWVPALQGKELSQYLAKENPAGYERLFQRARAKHVRIKASSQDLHVDDQLVEKTTDGEIGIKTNEEQLHFFI